MTTHRKVLWALKVIEFLTGMLLMFEVTKCWRDSWFICWCASLCYRAADLIRPYTSHLTWSLRTRTAVFSAWLHPLNLTRLNLCIVQVKVSSSLNLKTRTDPNLGLKICSVSKALCQKAHHLIKSQLEIWLKLCRSTLVKSWKIVEPRNPETSELINLVTATSHVPLARFWYFPSSTWRQSAVAVLFHDKQ